MEIKATHLDRHTCAMETMGEQHPLSQHPLVSRREIDFGYGKRVAQVQRSIHIRVGKVSKPLWKLFLDLCRTEVGGFFRRWCLNLEETFLCPSLLITLLYCD